MNILAIIPARSGSKSVIDKNIRDVAGRPMLAWSVEHAQRSRLINRIILSTDSERYAEIGRRYGAETPFIRPSEYATDTALDIQVFEHALNWLRENEDYEADIVVQLRPTYPKRNPEDIDRMIEMLLQDETADSVRSVAAAGEVPYKMWLAPEKKCRAGIAKDGVASEKKCRPWIEKGGGDDNAVRTENGMDLGIIQPLIHDIPECYNMPRQELPTVYYQNACIDVMRADTVLKKHSMTGDRILGYLMEENLDIDTEKELLKAEIEVLKQQLAENRDKN